SPVSLANDMRSLHEHMVSRRPGPAVWAGLLALYLCGVAGSVGAGLLARRHNAEHAERAREEQIAALADRFEKALVTINDLRAKRQSLRDPGGRDRAEAERVQDEVSRVWQEMLEEWKAAPVGVQTQAKRRVLEPSPRRQPGRLADVRRLFSNLGAPAKK